MKADAAAKAGPDPGVVYRFGKAIGDQTMTGFGSFLAARKKLGEGPVPGQFGTLGRTLPTLFCLEELLHVPPVEPLIRDVWFPELQVMAARTEDGSSRGFYVAAKGGHNAESHNHNDIGSFIVYHDGLPALPHRFDGHKDPAPGRFFDPRNRMSGAGCIFCNN